MAVVVAVVAVVVVVVLVVAVVGEVGGSSSSSSSSWCVCVCVYVLVPRLCDPCSGRGKNWTVTTSFDICHPPSIAKMMGRCEQQSR